MKKSRKRARACKTKPGAVTAHKARAAVPYDVSFEAILKLGWLAKQGVDVGALLVRAIDENLEELIRMPEFAVAVGVAERPEGALEAAGVFIHG